MESNNRIRITAAVAIAAFALMFFPIVMTEQQAAHAAGAVNTEDPNGFLRKFPLTGFTAAVGSEFYIEHAIKNFGTSSDPNSMRLDWKGKETDSLLIGGFINVVKGDGNNANWCVENAGNPGEEISTKINGGPHTSSGDEGDPNVFGDGSLTTPNAEWADTADFGLINAEGDNSRLRFEYPRHPDYQPETAPSSGTQNLPLPVDLCSVPGGWMGFMTLKLNKDTDCNGIIDKIDIYNYVDHSGLNAAGEPKNNWKMIWYKSFTLSAFLTAGKVQSYVENIEQPSHRYQTIRVDNQNEASWENTADPPYKFVTLKQFTNIKKDTCPTPPTPDQYDAGYGPGSLAATTTTTPAEEATTLDTQAQELEEGIIEEEEEEVVVEEEEDELAQEEDPQSEDNNDVTADATDEDNNEDEQD